MFPIGDENRQGRGTAWLTWTILALNVLVFMFAQGWGADSRPTRSLAAVPAEILSGRDLVTPAQRLLDPWTGRVVRLPGLAPTPIPVYLTLITSLFLHGGLAHLFGNMLFLSIFGDNVELRIGRLRFLILYLAAGVLGSLAHVLSSLLAGADLQVPLVGASGAIAGIMGAYLALFPGNRVIVLMFGFIPTALSAWLVIGFWFLMQVAGELAGWSAGSGVAYAAHVGGFLVGWLWARGYARKEAIRLERERRERLRAGESGGVRWWIVD